jgi:signal transduction histidine kinase
MSFQANPRLTSLYQLISKVASIAVIFVGGVVIVGWISDIPCLKSIHPSLVTMKANTAVGFILIGLSLWLLQMKQVNWIGRITGQVMAAFAALLGLLTLSEYVFGWNIGIDQVLIKEQAGAIATSNLGRMAPNTAFNFLLVGLALLFLDTETRRGLRPAQILIIVEGVISLVAFIGYAYGARQFYGLAPYTKMALHTAVVFNLAFLGVICARPNSGLMAIMTADSAGGIMMRRLLPISILILLVTGWLRLLGQKKNIYDLASGTSIRAVVDIIIFSVLVMITSRALHHADIERKQLVDKTEELNERLRKRSAELEIINNELRTFSYSVSHDLRTPLRSIDGFSRILSEDYQNSLDMQGKDYLQRIRGAAQRMAILIDDLLKLSRVTRAEMHCTTVDLSSVAYVIAAELQEGDRNRRVEFAISEGLRVQGDETLLRVVIENLLGNAWKFTSRHTRARIEFGADGQEGDRTIYYVRDDGAGFDMRYASKLFGAFQRLHAVTEFPGTGIGLATVQRIIHRHGGRVWAEGETEKGATFYFAL